MKKLLTLAAIAGAASLSYGQAYVNFGSQVEATATTNSIYGPTGGSGPTGLTLKNAGTIGTTYYYALFVAPTNDQTLGATVTGDPTLSGWTFTGDYATNGSKGNFLGYGPTDTSSVQIPGYAPYEWADFLVVGWSANIGSTWSSAETWWNNGSPLVNQDGVVQNFGISIVGQVILAPVGGPYNYVMGPAAYDEIPGINLESYYVPEPATMALCGLGAATLVIFRRRI
jgi:PEP-CTERM motif